MVLGDGSGHNCTDKDITMPELVAKLEEKHSVTAHPASLSRFLIKQGFTVKKRARMDGHPRSFPAEEDIRTAGEWFALSSRPCSVRRLAYVN
jgi:hypothetical protein